MELSSIFRSSALYFLTNITRRGVGFLLIPLYTHYLRPADYGITELVELFVTVASISFGVMAIGDSMVRIYHEYPDSVSRATVVSTAMLSMAVVSFIVTALAWVCAGSLSMLVFGSGKLTWFIRAAFIAMCFGNFMENALVYERIRDRPVLFATFSLAYLLFNLCLNIYFIAFAGLGIWGFMLSKLVCATLGALVLVILVFREVKLRFQWEAARKMASFGGPLILTSVSFFIIHFADRFFLNHFANLSEVGIYALAYKFGFLVTFLVGEPFGNIWSVTLYAHTSQSDWKEQFGRVVRYLVFFLFLAGISISILADKALALVADPDYAAAALVVPILVLGYVFREVGDFFRDVLFINKRVLVFTRVTVACAVLNLVLDFGLIGEYKAAGAAWATLLTWLAYMVSCWLVAYQEHRIPYALRSFLWLCVLSGGTYFLAALLRSIPSRLQWGTDALLILFFVAMAWLTGYFPAQERALVKRYLSLRRQSFMNLLAQLR